MIADAKQELSVDPQRAASPRAYSQSVEDYVKTVYMLCEAGGPEAASTGRIADRLGVAPASVTAMLKRLAELRLLRYEPYQPVTLTTRGQAIALEVVRHHRLLERFLHDALGMSWDEIHEEAEVLEHHISERLEARIAERLGNPEFDPHGDPIPALDGTMPDRAATALAEVEPGTAHVVARVAVSDAEQLRYLDSLGIRPGAAVELVSVAPFEGPVTVRSGDTETALSFDMANRIEVTQ